MFLEIDSVSFAYPGKNAPWILSEYSLSMEAGERVGIAGPSGRGKSTLLRIIAGLECPLQGSVTLDGRRVASRDIYVAPEDRQVGMVFQDYGLFPHMTVAQNIAYGLFRLRRAERRQQVVTMLELIRMRDLAARYPYEISGGQQQRVAIARALAPNPKLLLLDEPLSNLDATLRADIRAEMCEIMESSRITCLFVSHDLDDLAALCGRIETL
ncbi:MAG: ABC transporter ATP-binding protein [Burkholderiales bacterium]|jgi:iron(III) transport system ATP-binding protein|nr:ABC transporter ATP-binding protein [Burkholderiales bacterium]